ncbi:MAG TPA: adenylate/guanylate cyclase domain-containing protein, partial [Chloroflexota bacterium]
MPELPTGTVTFLFTDVEGSTRLWEQQPEMMRQVLVRHDAIIEEAVAQHAGVIVRPRGEGDSRFAVFARPSDAVAAAVAIQQALHGETWPLPAPFRVRMALHTGEADLRDGDYYGSAVNRCARLRAITHGGQTLVSQATAHLIRDGLPLDAGLRDLGDQRLSDLSRPERVYQLLHPDLPAEFPPLRSLTALPHNLPLQLTSFIGRERELGELTRRLQTARLLTLTGSGGAGKTRLALQVAAELVPRYPDGVWLAELAPLADPALVRRTVAAAVGVREAPGQAILDTLLAALREKRLLLVLDNCEHVLDACARLADALLRGCPGVQLLAASREALGVAGEVSWRVPSLAVPSLEQRVAHEQVAEYDAVQLFVERAQAALPSFSITAQNAMALAQVCARLDGIPLALELAAARVKGLTVDQLADRLHDRFRLLTGGSRAALPRQQTLRAAIDWSYDLLDEAEQRLFRRLAVFAGGWTVEAAEAVCAGDGLAHEDVLDILLRLVDKSLALAEERRYRLLETVRQYGRDRLAASGEAGAVYARHAAFYLALAEELEPQFMLGGPTIGRDGLVAEIDNQRAALNWYADSDDVEAVLRLAGALLWYWFFQG